MSELSRIYRQESKTPYDPKRSLLRGVFLALFWLAVWEAISLIVGAELLVPSPRRVALRWLELAGTSKFWLSTALSLGRVALGFAAGTIIGVLLAFLTRYFGLARLLLTPVIRVVRAVPVASFIILALVWIKTEALPSFISAAMAAPMVWQSVSTALSEVDVSLLEMARVYKVPPRRALFGIVLPAVYPAFMSGALNALGFAWSGSIEQGVEHQKHLARYIIARYGALPVVWTLSGEVAGYFPGKPRETAIKGWREVAKYVEKMDGYGTLQTAHYTNERPFADYYYDESWFDFVLNQAGHGDFPINPSWYRAYRKEHGTKPFIEGESLYEYCSTLEENGTRLCTDAMLRRVAYMAVQTGGCGYTYGAQGIWDNIWEVSDINPDFNAFNKFGITWAKAIDGPGGAQMGYLKRFYEEHHFEEMVPYEPAEMEESISPFANKLAAATISRDKTRALIYYGEMDGMSTPLAGLCDGIYAISWFDPRTGQTEKAEIQVEVRGKSCIMPKKPAAGDWVLIAECIEKTEK